MLVVDQGAVSHNCCWLRPSTAWVAWKVSEDGWEEKKKKKQNKMKHKYDSKHRC